MGIRKELIKKGNGTRRKEGDNNRECKKRRT